MVVLNHFRGAATRIAVDATAFDIRREHFLVEAVVAWGPEDEKNATAHRAWARGLSQALAPSALPVGYANLPGPDQHDQIALVFGANIDRLREVKRRFDPDSIFSAIPPPAMLQPTQWFSA
jgi:FAD/FMN-containing dehydrogenase